MISTNPSEIPFSNIFHPAVLEQFKLRGNNSTAGLIVLSENEITLQSPGPCLNASKAEVCIEILTHAEIMLSSSYQRRAGKVRDGQPFPMPCSYTLIKLYHPFLSDHR